MVNVVLALTGEPIAVYNDEDLADCSVKALKRLLAHKVGKTRFQLELLGENCLLDDEQTLTHDEQTLTLLIQEFVLVENDHLQILTSENDWEALEKELKTPRDPNFRGEGQDPALWVAASAGNIDCLSLLLEAGAEKDEACSPFGETSLWRALSSRTVNLTGA